MTTRTERPPPDDADADRHHRRRLESLMRRLPGRLRRSTLWLLEPESRWARIPAGALLILGGCLSILPVLGIWMLPLGVVLIAEDVPALRRIVARWLVWMERRWPRLFEAPASD
jgi:hypothetical protein